MASSGKLRRVALVRTDVSEELNTSIIRVTRIGELGTTANDVPSSPILVTLVMETLSSSETSVLTRATRRNIPEDAILHSHRRENLKSYMTLSYFNKIVWRLRRCSATMEQVTCNRTRKHIIVTCLTEGHRY
jgi:hypothetical protein